MGSKHACLDALVDTCVVAVLVVTPFNAGELEGFSHQCLAILPFLLGGDVEEVHRIWALIYRLLFRWHLGSAYLRLVVVVG